MRAFGDRTSHGLPSAHGLSLRWRFYPVAVQRTSRLIIRGAVVVLEGARATRDASVLLAAPGGMG